MALSKMTRFEVLKRDGFACVYCGAAAVDGVRLHVDHVTPRSRGGRDLTDNLVTACQDCNLGKAANPLSDWTPFVALTCWYCEEAILVTRAQHSEAPEWVHVACAAGRVCCGCGESVPAETFCCPECLVIGDRELLKAAQKGQKAS